MRFHILSVLTLIFWNLPIQAQTAFGLYLLPEARPHGEQAPCTYCLDIGQTDLSQSPLLSIQDIEYYDWGVHTLKLTEQGVAKLSQLTIPDEGLAFAIYVEGEPVYGGWLWSPTSSHGCDRVYAMRWAGRPVLQFSFGLPANYAKGEDPRSHPSIQAVFERFDKLKGM
ncbi:hypothetical protein [Pontibacter sp. G13]|uniref:hypothetical protein n=1 Tax=Pontibacter sp. G13 TaxID=3074898 RepID=UPI00288A168A|nr:hypothetical protein [Pontibacter sp. G13]WNJ18174.1 hypothetical protein RJD25_25265 [Pontibacter sp. G13]